jgi:hypothetical protein
MDLGGVSFLRLYKPPHGLYNTSRVNNYNLSVPLAVANDSLRRQVTAL